MTWDCFDCLEIMFFYSFAAVEAKTLLLLSCSSNLKIYSVFSFKKKFYAQFKSDSSYFVHIRDQTQDPNKYKAARM